MKYVFLVLILLSGCASQVDFEELEVITRNQISENDNEESCFVGYKGLVYDLTDWLQVHPSTEDVILQYCGTVEEFEEAYIERHGDVDYLRINEPVGILE